MLYNPKDGVAFTNDKYDPHLYDIKTEKDLTITKLYSITSIIAEDLSAYMILKQRKIYII